MPLNPEKYKLIIYATYEIFPNFSINISLNTTDAIISIF